MTSPLQLPKHPRFPFGMAPDVRLAIGDELDVTLAGYPMYRAAESRDHALTVYAEQLGGFAAVDVHEGFRLARAKAETYAPTPTAVRHACGDAFAARTARIREEVRAIEEVAFTPPDAIPDWRSMLAGVGRELPYSTPRALLGAGQPRVTDER